MKIKLSEIRIDGGTQGRVELDQATVDDYAEAYAAGVRLPDVSVFHDGSAYWLADGFHRYFGAKKANKTAIDAEATNGTQRDAWLYSLGANADHGLRRSNEDKRKAVTAALADDELGKWSNRQIAEQCNVSPATVDRIRHEAASASKRQIEPVRTVERNGKTYTVDTSNIGRDTTGRRDGKPETPGLRQAETGQGEGIPSADGIDDADDGAPSKEEIDAARDQDIAEVKAGSEKAEAARERLGYLLLDSDDPASALAKDVIRLEALTGVLQSRLDGLTNENSRLKAAVKRLQAAAKK